jgi:NADH-quinone oxidoreductase subunit N
MLLFFGLGSLVVGALGALTERVFKKFLAYSSINQIGFVLIALATGQITGLQSSILFFILYVLTSLALFAVFLNLEDDRTR